MVIDKNSFDEYPKRKLKRRKGKHRLTDVTVDEISLVDNPAVPAARFLLFKRDGTDFDLAEEILSDPDRIGEVVAEFEALPAEEREAIEKEAEKILLEADVTITLSMLHEDFSRLQSADPLGIAKRIKTNPEAVGWKPLTGFYLIQKAGEKTTPDYLQSQDGARRRYTYDLDRQTWVPQKGGK